MPQKTFKKFNVTFTTKEKYSPVTRTITVEAEYPEVAEDLILRWYGATKVTIDKTEEIETVVEEETKT
jgi:hypothetical protein